MRKRKLYLSELLKRTLDKNREVHITNTKDTMNLYYEDVYKCLQDIRYSYLWNLQVNTWCTTNKVINIQIIEVE